MYEPPKPEGGFYETNDILTDRNLVVMVVSPTTGLLFGLIWKGGVPGLKNGCRCASSFGSFGKLEGGRGTSRAK